MDAAIDFNSDFLASVEALFSGLQRSGYALRVKVWRSNANNVLEVLED
jgi:hypothetical protein